MKKVLLNNILSGVRKQRFEKGSFTHLMQAYEEGFQAILLAMKCDPTKITILSGADVAVVGSDFDVASGWGAYNNELFQIDANAFTASGGETAVWVIEETFAGDPVKFDDGNEFDVNQIRKLKLQSGVSHSGVADYNEVVSDKWIDLTLENSHAASPSRAPQIQKNGDRIRIKGTIDTSSSTGVKITTLPDGFRPEASIVFAQGSSGGQINVDITIAANGDLTHGAGFAGNAIHLDMEFSQY